MTVNSKIGGQAVMEGIMMRNDDKYAIGVRKPDGEIEVKVEDYKHNDTERVLMKIPIVRGVYSFINSMVTGISCLMYSSTFFEEEEGEKEDFSKLTAEERKKKEEKKEKQEKAFMTGTLILAILLAVGIFMAIPYFLMQLMERWIHETWALSLFESIVRIVIFMIYIILISRMKDIQRTFMYHGAEHKCINCVEHGLPLNVGNVLQSSRFHKRCGTSFLFFVIIVTAIFLMLIQAESHLMRIVIRILLIPVIAGVSYEIIRFAGSSDSPVMNALSKPGLAIQKLTTKEPDATMAEVAIAAVEAVFDWRAFLKTEFDLEVPRLTLRDAVRYTKEKLKEAGIEESGTGAKLLALFANKTDPDDYLQKADTVMTDTNRLELDKLIQRRIDGEPVQYITGYTFFYGHTFEVAPDVLIPRFDTENLVHAALEVTERNADVLDLCTGSGCIAISMCLEKRLNMTGSDISDAALAVARKNSERLDTAVTWVKSNLFADIKGTFDTIVSNPPYIRTAEIETLDEQVRAHEPKTALDGGADGLDFYRKIAAEAPAYLKEGGHLCLEIGSDQAEAVSRLLADNGFDSVEIIKDLSGLDRVVSACKTLHEEGEL